MPTARAARSSQQRWSAAAIKVTAPPNPAPRRPARNAKWTCSTPLHFAGERYGVVRLAGSLIGAARLDDLKRVVVVGGAGSLLVAPGLQRVDAPSFPAAYKAIARAHREALGVLRQPEDLDWNLLRAARGNQPRASSGGLQGGCRHPDQRRRRMQPHLLRGLCRSLRRSH